MKISILFTLLLITLMFASGCTSLGITEEVSGNDKKSSKERDEINNQFPFSPREELLAGDEQSKTLLDELKSRYKQNFLELQKNVNSGKAKLAVVNLTTEYGSKTYKEGVPFLESLMKETGTDYVDISSRFNGLAPTEYTQMPKDGHLSKKGAEMVAAEIEKIILKYDSHKSDVTYAEKPKVFGDGTPNQDEILDGGKDLPYRQKINSQGLRMDFDLTFPKQKQRILIMGDSQIKCPFLDNEFTVSGLLQKKFPDKEIINAANVGYSIDDHLSLFNERTKYAEPDIVIVQTGGGDILDQYFSQRNHFSRADKVFQPNEAEKNYYPKITSR